MKIYFFDFDIDFSISKNVDGMMYIAFDVGFMY
jgi:hypothetical protein